ncbi:MAG: DUF501 domain-containing protein [Bifidobacteriaceae bacterium]|nr:DUF501 domain-containing protein [Bifidobacteriaceae bacterium]
MTTALTAQAVPQADRARRPVTEDDLRAVARQLGRPVRGARAVAASCVCGEPLVVETAPRLPDGTPFPTLYYLTHPQANRALGRLESEGLMAAMNERLAQDPDLAAAYAQAHRAYLAARGRVGQVEEIDGVSAGGMPDRVKCLHALAAHALAAGPGVNPIGDQALVAVADQWRPDRCACRTASSAVAAPDLAAGKDGAGRRTGGGGG